MWLKREYEGAAKFNKRTIKDILLIVSFFSVYSLCRGLKVFVSYLEDLYKKNKNIRRLERINASVKIILKRTDILPALR